jgi:hypothetical protein
MFILLELCCLSARACVGDASSVLILLLLLLL